MNVSNCCGAKVYDDSDLCSQCHEHCVAEPELSQSIQIYLDYRKATRQFKDQWLKSHGLNYDKLKVLESEAIAEMVASGQESIEIDGYTVTLESKPIRIAKDEGKVINTKHFISIHARR